MVNPVDNSNRLPGAASSFNLQAFVELEYVKVANDVMVSQMQSLQNSLGVSKKAMDLLTKLQNLHNMVKVDPKGEFVPNYSNLENYQNSASAFFGTPVQISPDYGSAGLSGFLRQMSSVLGNMNTLITQLSAITPLIDGSEDSNSLLAKMRIIKNDIVTTGANANSAGASNWLTDKYNITAATSVSSAGLYQQGITNAITAGQSLNTTQTESVRNFLYIYEEYYKSASAVLQQITQIIQKMADAIAK